MPQREPSYCPSGLHVRSLVKLTGTQTRQEQPGWWLSISMATHHWDIEMAAAGGGGGVANQLAGCLPRIHEALGSIPAPPELDIRVHICHPSAWEVPGHPRLHTEVEAEARLAMRPLKKL